MSPVKVILTNLRIFCTSSPHSCWQPWLSFYIVFVVVWSEEKEWKRKRVADFVLRPFQFDVISRFFSLFTPVKTSYWVGYWTAAARELRIRIKLKFGAIWYSSCSIVWVSLAFRLLIIIQYQFVECFYSDPWNSFDSNKKCKKFTCSRRKVKPRQICNF